MQLFEVRARIDGALLLSRAVELEVPLLWAVVELPPDPAVELVVNVPFGVVVDVEASFRPLSHAVNPTIKEIVRTARRYELTDLTSRRLNWPEWSEALSDGEYAGP